MSAGPGIGRLDEAQRERYARHIQLPEIGPEGQRRLLDARVLVIGAGGLGSPVIMYLSAAGVGKLVLCDFDRVDLSNLQRQIVHRTEDVGREKVLSAADAVRRLNPEVEVETIPWAVDGEELSALIERVDVVVDGSDNFETRFELNRRCVRARRPLVSGAAVRLEGQVLVVDPRDAESPCYRCLYDEGDDPGEPCAQVGVLSPLLGVVGSVQAVETVKLLLGRPSSLTGRLVVIDAATMRWRNLRVRRDPACPVCGDGARL